MEVLEGFRVSPGRFSLRGFRITSDTPIIATASPALAAMSFGDTVEDAFTGGTYESTIGATINTPTLVASIDGAPFSEAQASQPTVGGEIIRAGELVTDSAGNSELFTTRLVVAVAPQAPIFTASPTLEGEAKVGETLTVTSQGTVSGDYIAPIETVVEKTLDPDEGWVEITTASTYEQVAEDEGYLFRARSFVSYLNEVDLAESTSAPVGPTIPDIVPPDAPTGLTDEADGATGYDLAFTAVSAGGSIHHVILPISSPTPSPAQIAAGLDASDESAMGSGSTTIVLAGAYTASGSGIIPSTEARAHIVHEITGAFSAVVSGDGFTTEDETEALAPVNTVLPVISGDAIGGSTLTVSTGTWDNAPTGYSYQWLRGGLPIPGETGTNYIGSQEDINTAGLLTATVTAGNAAGSASATSLGVGPIVAPTPTAPHIAAWGPFLAKGGSNAPASDSTPAVVTLPSGRQVADILVVERDTAREAPKLDGVAWAQTGWTAFTVAEHGTEASAGASRIGGFWRRCDGTESDTLTFDAVLDHQCLVAYAVRGCPTDQSPIVAQAVTAGNPATNPVPFPAVDTGAVANCLIAHHISRSNDSAAAHFSNLTNAALTSLTEHIDEGTSLNSGGGMGIFSGVLATAGSSGATQVDASNANQSLSRHTVAYRSSLPYVPPGTPVEDEDEDEGGGGTYGTIASGTIIYFDTTITAGP